VVTEQIQTLRERFADGVGFVNRAGGRSRPDAASWAVLALQAAGTGAELVEKGRDQLAAAQSDDGRVSITPEHPKAYWPTSLAILAWHGVAQHRGSQEKAAQFLIEYSEIQTQETQKEIVGYDTTLRGWSWTADAFSWVEPTALAMIALRVAGYEDHPRVQDAVALLMDRQLPEGGWNVGAPVIFGRPLRPMPENTGMALQALSGLLPKKDIEKSIRYLASCLGQLCTPLALGWSLLGLRAWGEQIDAHADYFAGVVARQQKYGIYDTVSLGVLLTARYCQNGLIQYFNEKGPPNEQQKGDDNSR
jgi:hypothetical protein